MRESTPDGDTTDDDVRPNGEPDGRTTSVVVMGVAGSGKTTVGTALAERLGSPFVEGDEHHPPENVAKMAAGVPLDDTDRRPWLAALNLRLRDRQQDGGGAVLACSALTADHRERLGRGIERLVFVYLEVDEPTARRRLRERAGHYMPASMADSQFATLEAPGDSEAVRVDASSPVETIVDHVVDHLRL
jgi:gluconokinase